MDVENTELSPGVRRMLATVGQRMIQATANMLAAKFFAALETETGKVSAA